MTPMTPHAKETADVCGLLVDTISGNQSCHHIMRASQQIVSQSAAAIDKDIPSTVRPKTNYLTTINQHHVVLHGHKYNNGQ